MKRVWFILAAFLGLVATAAPASAALVYQLDCDKDGCSSSNNYGKVTIVQRGSGTVLDPYHVLIDVNLISANNHFVGSGAGYAINWNITNNPTLTTTTLATSNTPPAPAPLAGEIYHTNFFDIQDNTVSGKTYKASPFGDNWMYAIDYNQSGGNTTDDDRLVFDVTKPTGNLVLADFTTSAGMYFAVDIYNTATGKTFVVAADTGVLPEPGTWTMSIAGLAGLTGLVMLRRRRKLARA